MASISDLRFARALRGAFLPAFLLAFALPAAAQDAPAGLTGSWAFTVVTENGTGTGSATFEQEGDELSGSYTSARLGTRAFEGEISVNEFRFTLNAPEGGEGIAMTFLGEIRTDGTLAGIIDFGGMGSAEFTARRVQPG